MLVPYDPEDNFSDVHRAVAVMRGMPRVLRLLESVEKNSVYRVVPITSYDLFRYGRIDRMPARKGKKDVPSRTSGGDMGQQGERGKLRWVNIPLSAEDVDYLDGQTATLEQLAARLLSVADDGYGISIRRTSDGAGISASLIRNSGDNSGSGVGVSAFAGNVRDACLALVYKFEHKLAGELPLDTQGTQDVRRRFG